MINIPEKVVKRLEKLLAMTASSNTHEADNAQQRINALCSKHKIDISELLSVTEEKTNRYIFWYNMPYKKLVIQILYMLFPERPIYSSRAKQNNLIVELTDSEWAEFELHWKVWKPALKQFMEDSVSAFIQANNIYPATPPESDDDSSDDVDWDKLARIDALAQNIDPTAVHKALESK